MKYTKQKAQGLKKKKDFKYDHEEKMLEMATTFFISIQFYVISKFYSFCSSFVLKKSNREF